MESNYSYLQVEITNGILIARIDRPKALNALNTQVFAELGNLISVFAPGIQGLKGIVITGSGDRAFAAGADISEFTGIGTGKAKEFLTPGNVVLRQIETFHRPVIAAVNGFALGGGCELAMACHLRIAGEKARFGLPEASLGILPGYGGTQRLPQLIGKSKALEMMLTGDMITAEEAFRLGLVNHLTEAGKETEKAIEIIEKISSRGPLSIQRIIAAVNTYYPHLEAGIDEEGNHFRDLADTADFREGVAAFLGKRKAVFEGK
ncbi:MAG TPA: enoyl-CoA hydratase-related protein [Saprospiraceae bacterium]|nr:enoyl-CoA hydratase-related protein [Saprospiraceae bacterium]HNT21266.1 enoyl-CoA hydratase-related protein [Saprospiraceae bacterium]